MDRQAHDREIRPVDTVDSHIADPLLDAIGTSLVERLVSVHIITYLIVCQ